GLGLVLSQPSFGTTELEEDGAQAVAHIQVPTDEHPDHQHQRQLAHTPGRTTKALGELLDTLAGIELFQEGPRKAATQFVITGQLRYSKGHEESPFDILDDAFFLVCQMRSSSATYLSGIGPCGRPSLFAMYWPLCSPSLIAL